jgi:hypothetical protein
MNIQEYYHLQLISFFSGTKITQMITKKKESKPDLFLEAIQLFCLSKSIHKKIVLQFLLLTT